MISPINWEQSKKHKKKQGPPEMYIFLSPLEERKKMLGELPIPLLMSELKALLDWFLIYNQNSDDPTHYTKNLINTRTANG